jgi:DNA end-binding protein Ku
MAPRPYWKGHIRLSLVSFEVQLYTASRAAREFPLHQIDRKSGERIRYQTIVPGKGPVPRSEIIKGYEYEKDHYVLLEPEELEKLKIESKHTIDLVQFVDTHDIDVMYFDKPYYVAPGNDLAEEAFRVVRDALRQARKYALGQIVLGGRERIAALKPCGKGMVLETLRYGEEVRESQSYFEDIEDEPADDEQLDLAKELIRQKSAKFDPDRFKDHYDDAMRKLIKAKLGDRRAKKVIEEKRPTAQVINLMDALKKSLRGEARQGAPESRGAGDANPRRKARRRPARKRATRAA